MPASPPTTSRPRLLSSLALAILAALTLWLAASGYRSWTGRLAELTQIAHETGIAERRTGLVDGMRRDAGGTRAALRLARALLADELDQRWLADLPVEQREAERRRGLERLDTAHRLGLESLAQRPGSWEALLVIGGAEYLRLARRQDPGRASARALWLEPLNEAHRLAPLQPEPMRFLVAADLGNWSVLSAQDKERAVARLEQAFQDPVTFDLLSPAWLRVAPSLRQALAVVPDTPAAWTSLARYFARHGDWERYCEARRKLVSVQHAFASERLAEAQSRLRWGDHATGVQRLLWLGANTRPDAGNVELIERVLAILPPGAGGEASNSWLDDWLDWSLERCADAEHCPLSPASLRRLASLNRELAPATRALALAAAGSLRDAEAIERREPVVTGDVLAPEWTAYALAKARLLVARGEAGEALRLLRRVAPPGRDSIRYRLTHQRVAAAAGDDQEEMDSLAWLAARERSRWRPQDWTPVRGATRLELWPAEGAAGLRLRFTMEGAQQGAHEVLWDGSLVEILPAVDGRVVEFALEVSRGRRHLLEIRALEGAPEARAEVWLALGAK